MCDSRLFLVSSWYTQDRRQSMPQKQTVFHWLWDVGTPSQPDKKGAAFRAIKGLSVTETQQDYKTSRPLDKTTVWSVFGPHRLGVGGTYRVSQFWDYFFLANLSSLVCEVRQPGLHLMGLL